MRLLYTTGAALRLLCSLIFRARKDGELYPQGPNEPLRLLEELLVRPVHVFAEKYLVELRRDLSAAELC